METLIKILNRATGRLVVSVLAFGLPSLPSHSHTQMDCYRAKEACQAIEKNNLQEKYSTRMSKACVPWMEETTFSNARDYVKICEEPPKRAHDQLWSCWGAWERCMEEREWDGWKMYLNTQKIYSEGVKK